jgi:spermidine dehydrogenase
MNDGISRRDFLNGVALTIGAGLSSACGRCDEGSASRAAPSLGALNGSTDAALATAHALRDGQKYAVGSLPLEDRVDLVVVGAGISGLAAAYYYRQQEPSARILILENHDEFGGHARRCEMHVAGRLVLGYGGSEAIQSPRSLWSAGALALLDELNVQLHRFERYFDRGLYPGLGLSRGVLFTREAFGVDKLVTGDPTRMVADDIPKDRLNARTPAAFLHDFPLPAASREKLTALYTERRDVLFGKSLDEKRHTLESISYRDFLRKYWQLDEGALNVFMKRSHDFFALGIDGVPALDAAGAGYPGFSGLGLPGDAQAQAELDEPYIYHFPDGNASLARLLVRRMIPAVAPGTTMEDVVTARFDATKLDVVGSTTRLRLNSTVVVLTGTARGDVDVGYVAHGKLRRVRARHVVHGGYNTMLPYMMPDLGAQQRDALRACVKAPLVYAKVAVRNWEPWVRMGVHEVTNPMGFFSRIKLDYPVSLGAYRCARSPREPIGLHLVHVPTPCGTGQDQRTAWRMGRAQLHAMTYSQFEQRVFDELTRILGPGGFDARRDIAAIHIYRWGHGYAYGFNSLYDAPQAPGLPELARRPVGRVAIANSDAAWGAYAHCAIDEAARAVRELTDGR